MTKDTIFLVLVVISIAFIPCIAVYYHFKVGWDSRRKQRKIADFIEKASEQQIQAKDGPE